MLYDAILIDTFNLYYKKRKAHATPISMANDMIDFIEVELAPKLSDKSSIGKIFLLFDPLPENDGNVTKTFKYYAPERKSVRKQILRKYKGTRIEDKNAIDTIHLVKMFYAFRGKKYVTVISPDFEADDFAESIVKSFEGKNILMFSSDMDWARYISDKVLLCTGNPRETFGKEDYCEKFGFIPSMKTVVIQKALFGDPSDNIASSIVPEKAKYCLPCTDIAQKYLEEISKSGESLDDVIKRISKFTFRFLFAQKKRTNEEELFYRMICNEDENMIRNFLTNVQLIRSRCKAYTPYSSCNDFNKAFCRGIDTTLGRAGNEKKKPFKFGGVRLA